MRRWVEFAVIAVLLVCVAVNVPRAFSVADADGETAVANADHALRVAFVSVLDAEKAGANVSGLIVRLDAAGVVLGEAEMAFTNGNSSLAAGKADQCVGIADGVRGDAEVLKASALDAARTMFWMSLAFSVVSIAVFVVGLVFGWRWFKRRYVKRMLGMKPEVTSHEA